MCLVLFCKQRLCDTMFCFTLFFLTSQVFARPQQLYDGDSCRFDDGNIGICKLLTRCDVIYNQFKQGNTPKHTCGFIGLEPVICCPLEESQNLLIDTSDTTTTTESSNFLLSLTYENIPRIDPKQYGAVALRKCYEFGQRLCPIDFGYGSAFGGILARLGEFPHMAAIGYKDKEQNKTQWLCGGSIVSENFIISAAHCQYSHTYGRPLVARLGNLQLEESYPNPEARPQHRNIIKIFPHPLYKAPSEYHDIALFKLDRPVTFSYFVRQACLSPYPTNDVVNTTYPINAAGWGVTDWGDDVGSNDLLKVTLNLIDHQTCNKSYDTGAADPRIQYGVVDKWQICAGAEGQDTCQGDSGGPLMMENEKYSCLFDVLGITSIGKLCGSNVPGIYTRVYNYVPWLEQVIWGHQTTNFTVE